MVFLPEGSMKVQMGSGALLLGFFLAISLNQMVHYVLIFCSIVGGGLLVYFGMRETKGWREYWRNLKDGVKDEKEFKSI